LKELAVSMPKTALQPLAADFSIRFYPLSGKKKSRETGFSFN